MEFLDDRSQESEIRRQESGVRRHLSLVTGPWSLVALFFLLPFLMANKGCDRPITWGDPKSELVSKWYEDHKEIDPDSKCKDCHDDITSTKVKPKSHDASWIREHGSYSQLQYGYKNENVCALCHKQSDCSTCHQQEPPADHTVFWKNRGHGVMVSLDRNRCMSCHQQVDFCERCHSETRPTSHLASFGAPLNLHCNNCHFPINSAGAQECAVCHRDTPSHAAAPAQPDNALHAAGANCRSCHTPLGHPDNGMACTTCHQ